MKDFIVGFAESDLEEMHLTLVRAENAEHALDKFAAKVGVSERKFLDYVYDRSVDLSLAEHFWMENDFEVEKYEQTGQVRIDEAEFRRRSETFFGSNKDWAAAYLAHYFGSQPASDDLFPQEMLEYIWFEAQWADVIIADIAELPVIA